MSLIHSSQVRQPTTGFPARQAPGSQTRPGACKGIGLWRNRHLGGAFVGLQLRRFPMLRLEVLAAKPAAFVSFTGLTPDQFHALAADVEPHYRRHRQAAETTRRGRVARRRAPGGGRRHAPDLRGRLLLALVGLKVYPTYEVRGLLCGLAKA